MTAPANPWESPLNLRERAEKISADLYDATHALGQPASYAQVWLSDAIEAALSDALEDAAKAIDADAKRLAAAVNGWIDFSDEAVGARRAAILVRALSKARGEDLDEQFPRTLIQTSDVVIP